MPSQRVCVKQFGATVKKITEEQIEITVPDGLDVFWVSGTPYIHRGGNDDLYSIDEAERAGLITVMPLSDSRFPPLPPKGEVLERAAAWLKAREHAEAIGAAHVLIHNLYKTLGLSTCHG